MRGHTSIAVNGSGRRQMRRHHVVRVTGRIAGCCWRGSSMQGTDGRTRVHASGTGQAVQLCAVLRSWQLTPSALDLPGEHPALGAVTLRQLLAAWVVHDLEHIAQTVRVMAKQYGGEVGPWVPYLPVLTDHLVPRS